MQHSLTRYGPTPLWLHLNGGAAMMAALSENEPMFAASQNILAEALSGVKAYHNSPVMPFNRPMRTISECCGSRLITAKGWQGKNAVMVIPSLINGWEVFDIEEKHSFIAFLEAQGLTPLIVDWAKPQINISMNDYMVHHFIPLMQQATDAGYRIQGVVGYCMGGTMIAALYSAFQSIMHAIPRAVMIAPPWDFSYQTIDQQMRLQSLATQTYAMGDLVPNDFVQSLFWAIDPLQVLKKFRKFPHVKNADRFVRVEDWLNAGRPVSTAVIQTCLFDWYRDNKIAAGEWVVNGHKVSNAHLPKHTMIVAGEGDNLVPIDSIKPIVMNRPFVTVKTGHIGLMASDKAIEGAWKPIAEFLKGDKVS